MPDNQNPTNDSLSNFYTRIMVLFALAVILIIGIAYLTTDQTILHKVYGSVKSADVFKSHDNWVLETYDYRDMLYPDQRIDRLEEHVYVFDDLWLKTAANPVEKLPNVQNIVCSLNRNQICKVRNTSDFVLMVGDFKIQPGESEIIWPGVYEVRNQAGQQNWQLKVYFHGLEG